ncbi:glycosyltransferase [Leptotrichia sp. OH3620_COT-345]|nr:glycosyltransferase [Leptotrichia sp. OH3620_COT-345]
MKVLLFSEGKNTFSRSGVGQALNHQVEALGANNVEFTLNPDEDYDIVHINTLGIKSWRVLKKAKKKKKPVIYHTHTTYEDFKGSVKGSNQLAPIIRFWAKKSYNGADYLISPTEYTKNLITEKYLNKEKEIRVISNGVNIEKIKKDEELKKNFLKKHKINKPLIITAGLPFERKGIKDFVKIVERCSDYQFLWFGSSSIKSMLPKKIQKIIENPPKNLIFPGYVEKEELIGAFGAAKLFLFMTYEENEGIVVLEALSAKLPLVVRDIPVYENWLQDGINCFKARNNDEFYKKMVSIVNEKVENINEIIENGYKIAKERDLKKIGAKYKEYYEYILENKNI